MEISGHRCLEITCVLRSMYTGMLVEVVVEVVFIETVPNKTSTNILIYILLSILLRLTGTRDRLIGCIEKESILGKDISTCLPVSLNISKTGISLFSCLVLFLHKSTSSEYVILPQVKSPL